MAIDFETVTGNQSSANVLAQINNNFTKINSNPVAKTDFATNADTVDNKHASELIPGAATFLDSIISLDSLSVGRYFCTQTRQGWEPVTETGSRTFLIEVSLNTSNDLKNYKINYIAGAGAGESYYSDYKNGTLDWNRAVTDENIENFEVVKNTYDNEGRAGRITTYDDMIVYKEGDNFTKDNFIPVNDGTGNYYRVSAKVANKSSSGVTTTYYSFDLIVTVEIYNSNFSLIKTVSSDTHFSDTTYEPTSGHIIGQFINLATGDMIIGAYASTTSSTKALFNQGYYYFSAASNTCFFIGFFEANIKYINTSTREYCIMDGPEYWYNNHFGTFGWDKNNNATIYYVELDSDRSSVLANSNITFASGAIYKIAQKNNYVFLVTVGSNYDAKPSLIRIDIPTRSIQNETINFASSADSHAECIGGEIDDNYIYLGIKARTSSSSYTYKVFKYDTSLSLIASSPDVTGIYSYFIGCKNYVAIFEKSSRNSPVVYVQAFSKSNLDKKSRFSKAIYLDGYYNAIIDKTSWYNQAKYNYDIYGIPMGEDYVLGGGTVDFYNGFNHSNFELKVSLHPIINIANGTTIGYFANPILFNLFKADIPYYFDGLGLIFGGKYLDTSKMGYLLKGFIRK